MTGKCTSGGNAPSAVQRLFYQRSGLPVTCNVTVKVPLDVAGQTDFNSQSLVVTSEFSGQSLVVRRDWYFGTLLKVMLKSSRCRAN